MREDLRLLILLNSRPHSRSPEIQTAIRYPPIKIAAKTPIIISSAEFTTKSSAIKPVPAKAPAKASAKASTIRQIPSISTITPIPTATKASTDFTASKVPAVHQGPTVPIMTSTLTAPMATTSLAVAKPKPVKKPVTEVPINPIPPMVPVEPTVPTATAEPQATAVPKTPATTSFQGTEDPLTESPQVPTTQLLTDVSAKGPKELPVNVPAEVPEAKVPASIAIPQSESFQDDRSTAASKLTTASPVPKVPTVFIAPKAPIAPKALTALTATASSAVAQPVVAGPAPVEPAVESLATVKSAIASSDAAQPVITSSQATGEFARVCNTYSISSRCGTPGGYGAPIIPDGCSTSITAKSSPYNTLRKSIN
jgi:hypothetical protein